MSENAKQADAQQGTYKVVWPRSRQTIETSTSARRLDTLEGKTVGELWNWVFHGDKVFPVVERELSKRYPGIRFVSYDAFGSIHYGDERKALAELPDKLTQNKCDAVITGMGC